MDETQPVRVLIWDENPGHAPKEIYPTSIRGAIAEQLNAVRDGRILAASACLDDPEQGCTEQALAETDVLIWWGHARHREVHDEVAQRIYCHVHERGMGFIALHSAHHSKPFQWVLATAGDLNGGWRETDPPDTEEITVCAPRHPIAEGITDFTLNREEMYGAPFVAPPPQCVVFQSYFPLGGEYFPSGLCWSVGAGRKEEFKCRPGSGIGIGDGGGRVFYFRPGHETYPTYYDSSVSAILRNAVLWCAHRT